jgi:hypothetical protein
MDIRQRRRTSLLCFRLTIYLSRSVGGRGLDVSAAADRRAPAAQMVSLPNRGYNLLQGDPACTRRIGNDPYRPGRL